MKAHFKNYFEGKEYLEVPANGSSEYEVIYKPLTMTSAKEIPQIKDETHEGMLFFPLPDGNALQYNLIGRSTPPPPIEMQVTCKAKKAFIQTLSIKNWLK